MKEGTTPRQVNLKELQAHLAAKDILPAAELARITVDMPEPTAPELTAAAAALAGKLRQCRSDTGFNKVRAVTMALGRIGDPQAAQPLAEFLRQPGIQGHMNAGTDPATIHADHFSRAMRELFAASALYRYGDADGLGQKTLTIYLDDWRGIFVRYAGNVLAEQSVTPSAPARK